MIVCHVQSNILIFYLRIFKKVFPAHHFLKFPHRKNDKKVMAIALCGESSFASRFVIMQQVSLNFHYNQMNKISRNESAETVPRQTQPLTFIIYYEDEQVLRVTLKANETVGDLVDEVRNRLRNRFENIIGLCSKEGYYTLDYALTDRHNKITNIRNNQRLCLLLEEVVSDLSTPTLADFTFLACIGEGISSAVYLVRHCSNGRLYALKQIKKEYFREYKTFQQVLREKKILSELINQLPFVTHLEASFQSYRHLNFLLVFYPGGEFFYHLTVNKLKESEAKLCFAEIMVTMQQLHKKKILYRDLKPENIMVDFDGHMRLGDFGLCRINLEREEVAHSQCGSPEYMAYETKQFEGYSYAADFYTMGAIIYEMVKGIPPFYQDQAPEFSDSSEGFKELVLSLIEREPSRRLSSFIEMKKCRWLREIDWDKLMRKEYKMPTKLNLYSNYIHQQFLEKPINNEDLRYEQKYDKLMTPFFFISNHKGGIGIYYPEAFRNGSILKNKKKSTLKDLDSKSNRSKSNRSKNSSKSKDSKDSKSSKKEENPLRRKNIKETNLYTSPPVYQPNRHSTKERLDLANKSLSKGKPGLLKLTITANRSPLKFNKMTSVKSAGNLKATQYIRQLTHRDDSKRKKFL